MARKKRKESINSIAEQAGVSVYSVSCVINNRSGVSEDTRKRIQDIIDKTGYTRTYKKSEGRVIGLVLPGAWDDWYVSELMRGCIECAAKSTCNIATIICQPDNKESLMLELRKHNCDAAVITMPLSMLRTIDYTASNTEIPMILTDINKESTNLKFRENIGVVSNNSKQGGYILAKKLLSQGHQNIAFLARDYNWKDNNQDDRIAGWMEALQENGLSETKINNLLYKDKEIDPKLSMNKTITAVMCVDDYMALKFLNRCYKRNIRVPDDLTVTGFGNMAQSADFSPALTTVDQKVFDVGYNAMKYAIEFITGIANNLPELVLPVDIVERDSSAAPRK